MRTNIITAMLTMASAGYGAAADGGSWPSDKLCQGTGFEEQGEWYCRQVQRVTYQNMGKSGQYKEVVNMDHQTGKCDFAAKQYSGPLAPFNEPVRNLTV